ncbi:JmjC domain-containing protein [Peribacillus sp. NPDC096622]|uniref:JmjC domain-containing protein n=1 Tax=Peribacillus sp. NPDC096622 TaxID=3364396 RepID=UPI0037F160F1
MRKLNIKCSLVEETENFTKPILWKSFISKDINWNQLYTDLICEFQKNNEYPNMNINVNDSVKPWYKNKIHDFDVKNYDSLVEWFSEWLEGDNFCVLFDRITDYSEMVYNIIASEVIGNLGQNVELKIGADTYAIFGNYGYTPFGIHPDNEPIFLIHCGPEKKDIWYWEECPDESIVGRTDILKKSNTWKKGAVHVVLEPGDMIFIPKHVYHLLYTRDFSITLGTALFPGDAPSMIRTGITNLSRNSNVNIENLVSWSEKSSKKEQFNQIVEDYFQLNINELGEAIYQGIIDQQYKLKSNGGFIGSPMFNNVDNNVSLKTSCFKLKDHSVIASRKLDGDLVLYLRGRKVRLKENEFIEQAIKFINSEPKFSFKDINNILKDEKITHEILLLLYKHKCIEAFTCNFKKVKTYG